MSETSAPPVSIVEFLTVRLNEDEAVALAAAKRDGPKWESSDLSDAIYGATGAHIVSGTWEYLEDDLKAYLTRYDPARVLADIAAKRAVVEHAAYQQKYTCADCVDDGSVILSALASPYSDHPDYRDQWKP